jgi:hypothetical protein
MAEDSAVKVDSEKEDPKGELFSGVKAGVKQAVKSAANVAPSVIAPLIDEKMYSFSKAGKQEARDLALTPQEAGKEQPFDREMRRKILQDYLEVMRSKQAQRAAKAKRAGAAYGGRFRSGEGMQVTKAPVEEGMAEATKAAEDAVADAKAKRIEQARKLWDRYQARMLKKREALSGNIQKGLTDVVAAARKKAVDQLEQENSDATKESEEGAKE